MTTLGTNFAVFYSMTEAAVFILLDKGKQYFNMLYLQKYVFRQEYIVIFESNTFKFIIKNSCRSTLL